MKNRYWELINKKIIAMSDGNCELTVDEVVELATLEKLIKKNKLNYKKAKPIGFDYFDEQISYCNRF